MTETLPLAVPVGSWGSQRLPGRAAVRGRGRAFAPPEGYQTRDVFSDHFSSSHKALREEKIRLVRGFPTSFNHKWYLGSLEGGVALLQPSTWLETAACTRGYRQV